MHDAGLPSPSAYERTPDAGLDWQASLAYQPAGSNWVLKAGIRYGRSGRNSKVYRTDIPGTRTAEFTKFGKYKHCTQLLDYGDCHSGHYRKFVNAKGSQTETHTIMDFEAGVNIGIGTFGKAAVSGGMRMAQFSSYGESDVNSDPEYIFEASGEYHNVYESRGSEHRSFHGKGPEVSWDANTSLFGNPANGEFTLDWGANAAVLFGRQSVTAQHFTSYCHANGSTGGVIGCVTGLPSRTRTKTLHRSRRVTVPNLGGYIGGSFRYSNAKISFGYRADEFFNAMDGGQDSAKKYDRGFYGPYLNLSIGFGG
jgi:hypothetical protein